LLLASRTLRVIWRYIMRTDSNDRRFAALVSAVAVPIAILGCTGEIPVAGPPPAPATSGAAAAQAPTAAAPPTGETPAAAPSNTAPADAALASAAPAAPPAISIPQTGTITLDDGTTIAVENDDRVIIRGAKWTNLESDSRFVTNGLSYRKSVEFMTELQRRLRENDREKLGDLVVYPLRVNLGKGTITVPDRAAFIRDFDRIFPSKLVSRVLAVDPRLLFANAKGVMLGDGVVWANVDTKGRYGLTAVNQ
jgi:hypothetical protein